jgi:hypothetical protein
VMRQWPSSGTVMRSWKPSTRTKQVLIAEVGDDPLVGLQLGRPAIVWDHVRRHAAADAAALEQAATLLPRTVAELQARLAQKDAYILLLLHAGAPSCIFCRTTISTLRGRGERWVAVESLHGQLQLRSADGITSLAEMGPVPPGRVGTTRQVV